VAAGIEETEEQAIARDLKSKRVREEMKEFSEKLASSKSNMAA